MWQQNFMRHCFEIPEAGDDVTDLMLKEEEQRFLLQLEPCREYMREELCKIAVAVGLKEKRAEAERFVDDMFHRGVLNRGEDGVSYRTGTFYGRLDIFATEETESYDSLPREVKEKLDNWYFEAYLDYLGPRIIHTPLRMKCFLWMKYWNLSKTGMIRPTLQSVTAAGWFRIAGSLQTPALLIGLHRIPL